MSRYWSEIVGRLTPYVPGEQPQIPNLVKLNTNEHPDGPSPRVLAAIRAALDEGLRLYPDPNAGRLKQALAARHGLTAAHVFVGNGSDEVLAHAFHGLLRHEQALLFPDVTYSFYPVWCGLYDIGFETIPLAGDFSLRVEDYRRPNGGIVFANPNAPTGRALALADIERLLGFNRDSVVLVDEAYVDFGADSAAALVAQYPNLLVVQTLSKSRALAGLRVGWAYGDPTLIEALERIKNSFNSYPLDRLALAGAVAALEDDEYFDVHRRAVIDSREQLAQALTDHGFEVLPSAANFVFARHPAHDAAGLAAGLRAHGVIVRHFRLPRIEQFLRITVGSPAQNAALLAALAKLHG